MAEEAELVAVSDPLENVATSLLESVSLSTLLLLSFSCSSPLSYALFFLPLDLTTASLNNGYICRFATKVLSPNTCDRNKPSISYL